MSVQMGEMSRYLGLEVHVEMQISRQMEEEEEKEETQLQMQMQTCRFARHTEHAWPGSCTKGVDGKHKVGGGVGAGVGRDGGRRRSGPSSTRCR